MVSNRRFTQPKFGKMCGIKKVQNPDLGCYLLWLEKAKEMRKAGFEVQVSDLLERFAAKEDHSAGYDLADYFIRPEPDFGWALNDKGYPLFWDH